MRIHSVVKKDDAIYWQKIGVNDEGEATYAPPIVIKCRWDLVQTDVQVDDVVSTEVASNTIYVDRVLVIGSYVMLGGADVLDNLLESEQANPKLCRLARPIKTQSTIFELGWEQSNVKPGFQSDHIVVECQI